MNDDKIILDDNMVAQTFNTVFKTENKSLLTESKNIPGFVEESIKRFEIHPSIRSITKMYRLIRVSHLLK